MWIFGTENKSKCRWMKAESAESIRLNQHIPFNFASHLHLRVTGLLNPAGIFAFELRKSLSPLFALGGEQL